MSMIDGKTLEVAEEHTDEELLVEARAWGFETVEEFFKVMDEAIFEEENGAREDFV